MRHRYANQRDKYQDFWLALVGWFAINIATILLIQVAANAAGSDLSGTVMGLGTVLQLVLNVIAVILLALNRGYAGLGIAAAAAISLWLVVLAGISFVAALFVGGYDPLYLRGDITTGSIEVTYAFLIAALIVGAVSSFPILQAINKRIR